MTSDYANAAGGRFTIRLLGGFQVFDASGQRLRVSSRKARALLAYLAMPIGRSHARDELARLLWPNAASSHARSSLRRALSDLRSSLGAGTQSADDRVVLRPDMFQSDVERFVQASSVRRLELLGEATSLYAGEFLARLAVDSEPFTRWQLLERQYLRSRMLVCCAVRDSVARNEEYAHAS